MKIDRYKVHKDVNDIMHTLKDYMHYIPINDSVTPKKDVLLCNRSHEVAEYVLLFFDDVIRYMNEENIKEFDA